MLPFPEMGGQCRGLFVQGFEIPVVGDLPPGDPPDALDGVQLGGIGREKASRESVPVAFEEGLQRARPVPSRVVQYEVNAPASPVEQALKEVMEGLRVESGGRPKKPIFSLVEAERTLGCSPRMAHMRVIVLWR